MKSGHHVLCFNVDVKCAVTSVGVRREVVTNSCTFISVATVWQIAPSCSASAAVIVSCRSVPPMRSPIRGQSGRLCSCISCFRLMFNVSGEIRFGTPTVWQMLSLCLLPCHENIGRIARSKLRTPNGEGLRHVTVLAPRILPRSKLTAATDDPVERIISAV